MRRRRKSAPRFLRKARTSRRKRRRNRGVTRMRTSTACSMTLMRNLIILLKSTSEGTLFLGS